MLGNFSSTMCCLDNFKSDLSKMFYWNYRGSFSTEKDPNKKKRTKPNLHPFIVKCNTYPIHIYYSHVPRPFVLL